MKSLLEIILHFMSDIKMIDIWQRTSNSFVSHSNKTWTTMDDMYQDGRTFDKSNIEKTVIIIGDVSDKKGLDLGCGGGEKSLSIAIKSNLTVMDISRNAVSITNSKLLHHGVMVNCVQANGEVLPFKSDSLDYVVSNDCIEHIPDDIKSISEIYRVLKPNGIFINNVPNEWDLRNLTTDFIYIIIKSIIYKLLLKKPPIPYRGHIHMYDKKSFGSIVKKYGFKVESIIPIQAPSSDTPMMIGGYIPSYPSIERLIFKIINLFLCIHPSFSTNVLIFKLRK